MIREQDLATSQEVFRLSAQQRRLWLALQGRGEAFRAEARVRIEGDLRADVLREALQVVVDRHEILRTTFQRRRGIKVPFQVVEADLPFEWSEPGEAGQPFDEERGPLVRAALRPCAEGGHRLHLELPALCCDVRGLENLMREIAAAYGECLGRGELAGEPLQYADYANWQEEQLEPGDEEGAARLAMPKDLAASLDALRLPWQKEPDGAPFEPASLDLEIGPELARDLIDGAARRGVSAETVLLAAWQCLLGRLTGRPEIAVGIRCDGRETGELEGALGLYDWWAPAVVAYAGDRPFEALLAQAGEALREAGSWRPYGQAPGAEMPFFPVGFESHELSGPWSAAGLRLLPERIRACFEPFRLKLAAFWREGSLQAELHYDPAALTEDAVRRLEQQLRTFLRSVLQEPARAVGELAVLGTEESARLLGAVNATAVAFGGPALVHRRFEEWAGRDPSRAALACEDRQMTYGEVNAGANRLARHLAGLGAGPEERIAILLDRSFDFVVAILAALKAGSCYVPLDPAYPRQRLLQMIEEARVKVLVTRSRLAEEIRGEGFHRVLLDAERDAIERQSPADPAPAAAGENLAYVLFTSGSTGAPKGVAVEHRQLANYVDAIVRRLDMPPGAGWAAMSTFAADLGNTALFPALCTGGCFHLLSAEEAARPDDLARHFDRCAVDVLKIVPSHLAALLAAADEPARLLPRRWLVLGGEASHWDLTDRIRRSAPALQILNHYGPTETTVGATTFRVEARPAQPWSPATVPVGGPLANVRIALLDERRVPVPAGVPGEIQIGGAGVARGYLGRPDLTAERFVPDPVGGEPGARLYRTGDLARFLPGGEVEFLGRIDHQVKIRGFRVEIGEIEAGLVSHPAVAEAVVAVREDRPGEKRLAAYVVRRRGESAGEEELSASLRQRLPEHMIPAAFVFLPALPLTANGKVDRTALPAPEREQPGGGPGYAAPRDATERDLARIWGEVLRLERVGIHDNFFRLGGDSILSIEVIARANKAGLRLTPRQIFQHQTIAELALVVGTGAAIVPEQERASGELPLTPIQRWFFEREIESPHHWNQAVFFEVPAPAPRAMAAAADLVAGWHDAFRLRFERTDAGWRQRYAETAGSPWFRIDLSALPEDLRSSAIETACAAVQGSLDLSAGPIARLVFLDLGEPLPARLLWVVHHLAVDGVSWRILLADFAAACRQLAAGQAVEPPSRTSSYKSWAERLVAQAAEGALRADLEFWLRAVPETVRPLPVDQAGENTVASESSCSAFLSPEETRALLQEVPAAYRTQINDVLLAALARAVGRWTGHPSLLVELEGHGRDPLFEDLDLSRTAGWFTSRYPVHLDLSGSRGTGDALLAVKERLRAIPSNGLSHGVLRYLGTPGDTALLRSRPTPEIVFNYLGQLDQVAAESGELRIARESCGPLVAPEGRRRVLFEVVASVAGGRLGATWIYSRNMYRRDTVESLSEAFVQELRGIIEHCRSAGAGGVSPADFPLADLDQERLEKVLAAIARKKDRS